MTIPAVDRVLARTVPSDTWHNGSPCLLYTGWRKHDGYGLVRVGSRTDGTRRTALVHRVTWEAVHGPIPPRLVIDHLCRVRSCVNVAHLELVTQRENALRGMSPTVLLRASGRCHRGHDLTVPGAYYEHPGGQRWCRACKHLRNEAYRRRKRAAAAGGGP